ncbi:MAG: AAA family ATPase [Actinobacteria bacterium]|nr:AAA family ATPase [Actinomycetota bacterium]MBO0834847.1 AAA family ATPase [Actinomycetota bacterium]
MTEIVLLTGPTSAGKSTIGQSLQVALGGRTVWMEADRCFPRICPSPSVSLRDKALAFHRSALAWPASGFRLILDGSLPYEDRYARDECLVILRDYPLLIVGVIADAATLRARESRREDRVQGRALAQAADIHSGVQLDCVVNTSVDSVESCVAQIIAKMRVGQVPGDRALDDAAPTHHQS